MPARRRVLAFFFPRIHDEDAWSGGLFCYLLNKRRDDTLALRSRLRYPQAAKERGDDGERTCQQ